MCDSDLDNEVSILIKDFDEDSATEACLINIMSETLLASKKQRERWDRGEVYFDQESGEPEDPIEFETYADTCIETLYIVPSDQNVVNQIKELINKYKPEWNERIIIEYVHRDFDDTETLN